MFVAPLPLSSSFSGAFSGVPVGAMVFETNLLLIGMGLTLAFVTSIVLTLATSYKQLLKGYILSVVTITFFVVFFILIIGLKLYWLANYISVLSMLLLTVVCWATMIFHFPFTLQYSREGVEHERDRRAPFMYVNYVITAV